MVQSVVREDMSPQKQHWMVTLQEVFYPALAAVGIPCKYIQTHQSYSCSYCFMAQRTMLLM